MKTIKSFLTGILYLFIAALLIRYAVISLNYLTTDFIPLGSKEVLNFGVTFGIQAIVLIAGTLYLLSRAIHMFAIAYKNYVAWGKDYKNRQLIKYIEQEKYTALETKVRSTNDPVLKEQYITDYLRGKPLDNEGRIIKIDDITRSDMSTIKPLPFDIGKEFNNVNYKPKFKG
jgi:hypothetical protein